MWVLEKGYSSISVLAAADKLDGDDLGSVLRRRGWCRT
jgi:hypothetical protein